MPSPSENDEVDKILDDWRRQRPDLDPSPMGVFGRIARVAARQRADLTTMLDEFGLTPASFDVLANLRRSDPPHCKTPTELASSSMMSTGGMTFRIDKLEEEGLVVRKQSPDDRRVVEVSLTSRGKKVIDKVIDVHLTRERLLLAEMDHEQVEGLSTLLAKLEQSMTAASA